MWTKRLIGLLIILAHRPLIAMEKELPLEHPAKDIKSGSAKEQITVVTADKQKLIIERAIAEKSTTIKHLLTACNTAEKIYLVSPECTNVSLKTIFSLLAKKHKEAGKELGEKIFSELLELCRTINYLDIPKLLSACIRALINKICQEQNEKNLKQHVETLNKLPYDLQALIKQKFISKKFITLYVILSSIIKIREPIEHIALVNSVAISSDGKYILSGSANKMYLWDQEQRKRMREFQGHTGRINSIAINEKQVLTGSDDGTLRLWDLETAQTIKAFSVGSGASVNSVVLSPNAKFALSGSADGTLCLWDVAQGKMVKELKGHSSSINSVALSANIKFALSGSEDHTALMWDLTQKETVLKPHKILKTHGPVLSVALSSGTKFALTGSSDKTAFLWHLKSGKIIGALNGHSTTARSVVSWVQGKHAIICSHDNTVRLWNLVNRRAITIFESINPIVSASIDPQGFHLLLSSNKHIYYAPLLPQELVHTSLAQLIAIIKLPTLPFILDDNFFRKLLNDLNPRLCACLERHIKAAERKILLKKIANILDSVKSLFS